MNHSINLSDSNFYVFPTRHLFGLVRLRNLLVYEYVFMKCKISKTNSEGNTFQVNELIWKTILSKKSYIVEFDLNLKCQGKRTFSKIAQNYWFIRRIWHIPIHVIIVLINLLCSHGSVTNLFIFQLLFFSLQNWFNCQLAFRTEKTPSLNTFNEC